MVVLLPILDDLLNLIFPQGLECPFCGGPCEAGDICNLCGEVFEGYRQESRCARCGRFAGKGALISNNTSAHYCYECRRHDWPFVLVRAAGPYEGVLKEAIHRFKYNGRRSLAAYLAELMAGALRAEPLFAGVDLIIPVPVSGDRLRQRGFNQAALLAKEIGVMIKIPVDGRSLVKDFETPAQAGLSRSARESNLAGAFRVTNTAKVYGKQVLIIDDVFTTGSTMSAASYIIRHAGAKQVFGLTAAAGRYF